MQWRQMPLIFNTESVISTSDYRHRPFVMLQLTDKLQEENTHTCFRGVPLNLHPVEGLPLPTLLAHLVSFLSVVGDRQFPVTSPVWNPQVARCVQTPSELLWVLWSGKSALRAAEGPS